MSEEKTEAKPKEKKNAATKVIIIGLLAVIAYFGYTYFTSPKPAGSNIDVSKEEAAEAATDPEQWSYAFGRIMGQEIAAALQTFKHGPAVDEDAMLRAVRDTLAAADQEVNPEEIAQLQAIVQERVRIEQEELQKKGEENITKGEEFIASYTEQEGIVEGQDGVVYRVIASGEGDAVGDQIASVIYTGKDVDGTVFDSTEKNGGVPAQFVREGVIPGLSQVLAEMKKGDKWEVVIPSDQAYGPNGIPGVILPNATLVFEVEIVDIQPRPEQQVPVGEDEVGAPDATN